MRSYPIWVNVDAPDYGSTKSFGAKEKTTLEIRVGASKTNSHVLANVEVTADRKGDETFFAVNMDSFEGTTENEGWAGVSIRYDHVTKEFSNL